MGPRHAHVPEDQIRTEQAPAAGARTPDGLRTLARVAGNRAFGELAPSLLDPPAQRTLARTPAHVAAAAAAAYPVWALGTGAAAFIDALARAFPRFVQDLDATIDYDEETGRYNATHGRGEGHFREGLWDAFGYCYIAAFHARLNPTAATWALGHTWDLISTVIQRLGQFLYEGAYGIAWEFDPFAALDLFGAPPEPLEDTTDQDVYNRAVGTSIGEHNRDHERELYQLCWDAMVEGRLDLTAAGVHPRGRPLRIRR